MGAYSIAFVSDLVVWTYLSVGVALGNHFNTAHSVDHSGGHFITLTNPNHICLRGLCVRDSALCVSDIAGLAIVLDILSLY